MKRARACAIAAGPATTRPGCNMESWQRVDIGISASVTDVNAAFEPCRQFRGCHNINGDGDVGPNHCAGKWLSLTGADRVVPNAVCSTGVPWTYKRAAGTRFGRVWGYAGTYRIARSGQTDSAALELRPDIALEAWNRFSGIASAVRLLHRAADRSRACALSHSSGLPEAAVRRHWHKAMNISFERTLACRFVRTVECKPEPANLAPTSSAPGKVVCETQRCR